MLFAGHLFVFRSRRKDRVKILYWDRDGFAVWSKRLEEGTYAVPFDGGAERRREITAQELGALLSGIDLSTAKRRKRYRRAGAIKHFYVLCFYLETGRFPRNLNARWPSIRTVCRGIAETLRKIVVDLAEQLDRSLAEQNKYQSSAARTAGGAAQPQE